MIIRRLRRWTQIRAYLTPASLEHTGNAEMVLYLSRRISEVAEIRRDRMPYIESILSNVWQRRSMYFSENSADSNERM